jgi:hypothetical protein
MVFSYHSGRWSFIYKKVEKGVERGVDFSEIMK